MNNNRVGLLEFERFRLDTKRKLLWCDGEIVDMRPKAVDVLCVLATSGGEVLTADEIIRAVWPDSFVEDGNLTHQIYELRRFFRERGSSTEFIRTVPRRGYQFLAEISVISENQPVPALLPDAVNENVPKDESIRGAVDRRAVTRGVSKRFVIAFLGVVVLFAGAFGFWRYRSENGTKLTEVRSIAVLPIKSFDQGDEELRVRITDSLITRLGQIKSISVRPTNSMMKFVGSVADPIEIGRALEVDAVVDSRIQREDRRLRVTVQLVAVTSGEKIWSEQFDGDAGQLLNLQDAIAGRLLTQLGTPLTAEQRTDFSRLPTSNPDAYEEFLKGRFFWQKRTADSLRSAIVAFERSVQIDPSFAEAYAGLADSYFLLVDYSYDTSPSNVTRAQEYLAKAIELKPDLAEAHTIAGYIQTAYSWNWPEAEKSLLKAISLAPNSSNGYHRYGMLCLKLRRFAEAEKALRQARAFDPTSASINMNLGVVLYFSKRYDEAIAFFDKSLELDATFSSPRWYRARCLWMKGAREDSLRDYVKALSTLGDTETANLIEKNMGDPILAIRRLSQEWRKNISPTGINEHSMAILSAFLQDREETLMWLEKAVAARHPWTTSINAEPEFDFVRDEPRFREILAKLNLKSFQ